MALVDKSSGGLLLPALLAAIPCWAACKGTPSTSEAPVSSAPARSVATVSLSITPSASVPPPPSASTPALQDNRPRARCVAAGGQNTIFLGRLLGFTVSHYKMVRDRLGLLFLGNTPKGQHQLRRLAVDPPGELALKEEPKYQVVVEDGEDYWLSSQSIYYLKGGEPTEGRQEFYYVPAGEENPQPKLMAKDITKIMGEWDGWVYVLRLKDFFTEKLGPIQIAVLREAARVRSEDSGIADSFGWRYTFELLRGRPGGALEVVGTVPRSADTVYNGYVYGRKWEKKERELTIFRLAVPGGQLETIYRRKEGYGARGGGSDHISEVAVDQEGVFFYDASEGVVRKIKHEGGEPEVLVTGLAFHNSVAVAQDYLFVNGQPQLKKKGKLSYVDEGGKAASRERTWWWWGDYGAWTYREGTLEFERDLHLSVYEYLPGGTVRVHRLKTRPGYAWSAGRGLDDDCLYYTSSDSSNMWFYALPRTAKE